MTTDEALKPHIEAQGDNRLWLARNENRLKQLTRVLHENPNALMSVCGSDAHLIIVAVAYAAIEAVIENAKEKANAAVSG